MIECPYCSNPAEPTDSAEIYGKSYGLVWLCRPCDAYVGVHNGTDKPLGRLANKELRAHKIAAHNAFDPLWRKKILMTGCSKSKARRLGYQWLAKVLGIPVKQCHIGMFDVATCQRVVDAIKKAPV